MRFCEVCRKRILLTKHAYYCSTKCAKSAMRGFWITYKKQHPDKEE